MQEQLPSLFIIGPMGAGKTTVGRLLAKKLNREFIDSDQYIEEQTGADVSWIFEKEGEQGFRVRETRALKEITARTNIVLATGGGAVMSPQNRHYLKHNGLTIYLKASVNTQLKRTAKDRSRPLLNTANPRQVLQELYNIRHPLYKDTADIIIETGSGYPKDMLNKVLNILKNRYPEYMD